MLTFSVDCSSFPSLTPIFQRLEESYLYPLRLLSHRQTLFLSVTHYMISFDIRLIIMAILLTYYYFSIFLFTFRIQNKLLNPYSLNKCILTKHKTTQPYPVILHYLVLKTIMGKYIIDYNVYSIFLITVLHTF